MSRTKLEDSIYQLKGKTIAIVYIFENDNNAGMQHFFIWKSTILSQWMMAIESLQCIPFIIDVRTFVDKAMNRTLPHIDYVLNMNSGTNDLSAMALIPSTCSILGIPCIPCTANTIIAGENKTFSNAIAEYEYLKVPLRLDICEPNGIFRPNNLGNSMGVRRDNTKSIENGLYQQFINGYDITIPLVYNPLKGKQDFLPALIYLPENKELSWYNGEEAKRTRSGYSFAKIELCRELQDSFLNFVQTIGVTTFCRIDARFRQDKPIQDISSIRIDNSDDCYFVEINVMPTIRPNNNFAYAFSLIQQNSIFFDVIAMIKKIFNHCDIYMFLLVCSMLSSDQTKTKY